VSVGVLIPSRSRPEQLLQAVESVLTTSQATVLAYVDDDQMEMYDAAIESSRREPRFRVFCGPQVGPVESANRLIAMCPEHAAYGLITDDARMVGKGWDDWLSGVLDGFPGRIAVISPRHNLGEHVDMPFVSKEWIQVVGWYACPECYHFCWPILTGLIGEMTAIVYPPEQCFSVHHLGLPHSNLALREEDAQVFFEYVSLKLPPIVHRLRKAMAA